MAASSFRSRTFGYSLGVVISFVLTAVCNAQILYDNFQDDLEPYSYATTLGGELNWVDDGLNFVSSQVGGVAISTDEGELPQANAWSFRARFTINSKVGLGLAGVVVEHPSSFDPRRWAGVFSQSGEFALGQGFDPEEVAIPNGEIFGEPFVVQLDYSESALTGHFWRPDSPTEVTTIQRSRSFSNSPGAPRFANNGTDTTYHAIWVSRSPLPLPTGFEEQGDLNGNEILEIGDIDALAEQIQGEGLAEFDLNSDGVVDSLDQQTLVEDYLGTLLGDADLDGSVQFADFLALSEGFGQEGGWEQGDFDSNGMVEFRDFLLLSQNFGQPTAESQTASVPEPSMACYAMIAASLCCLVRRKPRSPLRVARQ